VAGLLCWFASPVPGALAQALPGTEALVETGGLRGKNAGWIRPLSHRPGAFADVVVLDLAAVRDRATYEQPHQLAEGMRYVFVNGVAAIAADRLTGVRGGRLLVRVRPCRILVERGCRVCPGGRWFGVHRRKPLNGMKKDLDL